MDTLQPIPPPASTSPPPTLSASGYPNPLEPPALHPLHRSTIQTNPTPTTNMVFVHYDPQVKAMAVRWLNDGLSHDE
ncbi:hypothetical protein KEM48_011208, partial [Puccinia striiformis f. sp. tritici PST-130]